jgi:hypothetical protein
MATSNFLGDHESGTDVTATREMPTYGMDDTTRELWAEGKLETFSYIAKKAREEGNLAEQQWANDGMNEMLDHLDDIRNRQRG